MINTAREALNFAHHPPEGVIYRERQEEYFRPFGYTIYRTSYDDPGLDQAWERLLNRLDSDFKLEISNTLSRRQHIESERQDTEKLISLVKFDARSDAAVLNGCSVEQLRTIFQSRVGGAPLNIDVPGFKYFLFADKEVLDAVARGENWVKIAEVLYDNSEHNTENHPRLRCKQTYWGWMKVATGSLFYTRMWLNDKTLPMLSMHARDDGLPQIQTDDLFPVMDSTEVIEEETLWERAQRLRKDAQNRTQLDDERSITGSDYVQ
ncbi:hypothetical protein MY3957_005618 [Beauveria namnaoensis]